MGILDELKPQDDFLILSSGISPNYKIILCLNGDGVLLKISGACYLLSLWKKYQFLVGGGLELVISEETMGNVQEKRIEIESQKWKTHVEGVD